MGAMGREITEATETEGQVRDTFFDRDELHRRQERNVASPRASESR